MGQGSTAPYPARWVPACQSPQPSSRCCRSRWAPRTDLIRRSQSIIHRRRKGPSDQAKTWESLINISQQGRPRAPATVASVQCPSGSRQAGHQHQRPDDKEPRSRGDWLRMPQPPPAPHASLQAGWPNPPRSSPSRAERSEAGSTPAPERASLATRWARVDVRR